MDWDTQQKDAFLRWQFAAQDQHYRENYPGAQFQLILLDEQPVGRLYIHRRADEIRIMDIALLPAFQKRGIGTHLINQIQEEAQQQKLPVTLHVERFNPALHFYARLGFRFEEERDVYYFMKWLPAWEALYETSG